MVCNKNMDTNRDDYSPDVFIAYKCYWNYADKKCQPLSIDNVRFDKYYDPALIKDEFISTGQMKTRNNGWKKNKKK